MARPGRLNLTFLQGTTWTIPFTLTQNGSPVSIAGSTITAKLRQNPADTLPAATFSCSIVDGPNGQGQAVLAAATTAALTLDANSDCETNTTCFLYQINVTLADGTVLGILAGIINTMPQVNQ